MAGNKLSTKQFLFGLGVSLVLLSIFKSYVILNFVGEIHLLISSLTEKDIYLFLNVIIKLEALLGFLMIFLISFSYLFLGKKNKK